MCDKGKGKSIKEEVVIDVEYDVEGERKMNLLNVKVYLLKLKVNMVLKKSMKMNLLKIKSMWQTMIKQVMIILKNEDESDFEENCDWSGVIP